MSEASNAVSAGPPPSADPQDPLPEAQWVFRRILTFSVSFVALAVIAYIVGAVRALGIAQPSDALAALVVLAQWLIGLNALVLTYYLVAPSAEQITKCVQVGAALRSGVIFRSTASAQGVEGSAAATSTAGKAAPPPRRGSPPSYTGPDYSEIPDADDRTPEEATWR